MVTPVCVEDIVSIQGQVSPSLTPYSTVEMGRDFVMGPPDEEDDDLEEELDDEDADEDEDEVDDDDLTEDEDDEDEDDVDE